jgi:hypothetical protein
MLTLPQTVRLHPAQQAFLKSDALYRAFCGGIGSGKNWAGSYDLIRRASPAGCTWSWPRPIPCSPTPPSASSWGWPTNWAW